MNYGTIPALGRDDDYFVGNGIVGVAVSTWGEVTMAIGCDYTSPCFIQSGKIGFVTNGTCVLVEPEMSRIRHTGAFVGSQMCGDIEVEFTDFTLPDMPFFLRKITLRNHSDADVEVRMTYEITSDKSITYLSDGVEISSNADCWCFGGHQESKCFKTQICKVGIAGHSVTTECIGNADNLENTESKICRIYGEEVSIDNGKQHDLLMYHYHYDDNDYDVEMVRRVFEAKPNKLMKQSLDFWNNWLKEGSFKSNEVKIQDVIEGNLFAIKMQQNRDGGIIAGIKRYPCSYVRDCHGAFRLLAATEHFKECRMIIINIHKKFLAAGYIPNWWSMGSDSFLGTSFNNDVSEITAYYLLMLRDYIKATKDASIFEEVYESAKWAGDAQLNFMLKNNYLLDFNGDETEQYVCKVDGETYGGFPAVENWKHTNYSFSATCIALTSLEFLAEALTNSEREDLYSEHFENIRTAIDKTFYNSDLQMHSWAVECETLEQLSNVVTNFNMIPLWTGTRLNDEAEKRNAIGVLSYINKKTGFLYNSYPDTLGFCGHSLGLLLYCMIKTENWHVANDVAETILNSTLLSRYGTVNEFYGPSGVPNPHCYRAFEGGIVGEALLIYDRWTNQAYSHK